MAASMYSSGGELGSVVGARAILCIRVPPAACSHAGAVPFRTRWQSQPRRAYPPYYGIQDTRVAIAARGVTRQQVTLALGHPESCGYRANAAAIQRYA